MTQKVLTRRTIVQCLAIGAALPSRAWAAWPKVKVHKDPDCSCCGGWAAHMELNGFDVQVLPTGDLNRVKVRLGIPPDLASCHTAEIENYVVEGHVPASAIQRLLTQRPKATGLAVPGMPNGSPGMSGEYEEYEVILFGPNERRVYARFKGEKEI